MPSVSAFSLRVVLYSECIFSTCPSLLFSFALCLVAVLLSPPALLFLSVFLPFFWQYFSLDELYFFSHSFGGWFCFPYLGLYSGAILILSPLLSSIPRTGLATTFLVEFCTVGARSVIVVNTHTHLYPNRQDMSNLTFSPILKAPRAK